MKSRYSIFSLARNAMNYHKDWERAWRSPEPKAEYDAVIVGAGGHGLATAYYLAKNHKLTNIAVVEKGWLGGGNTGRNTTIIRSNYLQDASIAIYELARSLYEDLSQELNFNVMFSPRGVMMLCQTEHEFRAFKRTAACQPACRPRLPDDHAGGSQEDSCRSSMTIPTAAIRSSAPITSRAAAPARHDAVAWGYARGADALGRRHHPELRGHRHHAATATRSPGSTPREASSGRRRSASSPPAMSRPSCRWRACGMPIESVCLQALVSEPIKPVIDCVIMANTVHGYISQSDKGELVIGGGADPYNNYSQRGSFPALEHTVTALVETFPIISRLRMLRMWGGIVDMTGDRSPIIGKTDVEGLYVNCGWGTGGFKSIPGSGFVFADTIANDRPHPIAEPFGLNRFLEGRLIDESVAAAVAH